MPLYLQFPSLPLFPSRPHPSPLLPLSSLICHRIPLEVDPLNPARGSGKQGPQPQTHFWHILCLGNTSGDWTQQFNGFCDNQLTKFCALQCEQ